MNVLRGSSLFVLWERSVFGDGFDGGVEDADLVEGVGSAAKSTGDDTAACDLLPCAPVVDECCVRPDCPCPYNGQHSLMC